MPSISYFFYEMRRYRKVRYYRRPRPSYNVNRKLIQSSNWVSLSKTGWYASTTEIVGNPSVLTSNSAGSMLTIKHLQVQLMNLPSITGLSGSGSSAVRVGGQPAGGWLIVYCPEGTQPSAPFPDFGNDNAATLYEPNQFVLGHGTWMQGKWFQQTNDASTVDRSGNVNLLQPQDNTPGNNVRIKCPLSKKLNPGDKIYLIFYLYNYNAQPITGLSIEPCQAVVSYASKSN